ncbi:MAG: hypothetical protein M3162_07850 [Thermoproteota archaeon]|nr:hypothetical protein [Thermoproteota archaeon]
MTSSIAPLAYSPRLFQIFVMLVIVLFIDYYIGSILDIVNDSTRTEYGRIFFAIILFVSLVTCYFVVSKFFGLEYNQKNRFGKYKKIAAIMQILLYVLAGILMASIFITSKYSIYILISLVTISYMASTFINLTASIKLFRWFHGNKNKVTLLFSISFFFIFTNNLVSLFLFNIILAEKPSEIGISTPIEFNFSCEGSSIYCTVKSNIISIQSITLIIYFVLFWICNTFLLHHHMQKIGKPRFFFFTISPLIIFYFLFVYNYDELYNLGSNLNFNENILISIQFLLISIFIASCGLLYGFGIKSISNLLKISPRVEHYLKFASYGIILFFISANATVVGAGLPPYGVSNIIVIPFASLLLYIGLSNAIVSISNDISVRKYIKNSTFRELKIVGNMAESQMVNDMKEKVVKMSKKYSKELEEKSNTESTTSEEDIKDYLEEAIKLFKKSPSS